MLPILYEFPKEIQGNPEIWKDPDIWWMVMPNLGLSNQLDELIDDWNTEQEKGQHEINVWASQHLNIQIGGVSALNRWAAAEFWDRDIIIDRKITIKQLIKRCDVIVAGIDGGGLDDLLGLALLGREISSGDRNERKKSRWFLYARAWAHKIVKERHKSIATKLEEFEKDGWLTFVDYPGDDVEQVADIIMQVEDAGLLAAENAIGVDQMGIGDMVNALVNRGIDESRIVGVAQGVKLHAAIKMTERQVAGNRMIHEGSTLMNWAVGNAKAELIGSAVSISKAVSGWAKIDPLMATFDAVFVMSTNPEPARSMYEDDEYAL